MSKKNKVVKKNVVHEKEEQENIKTEKPEKKDFLERVIIILLFVVMFFSGIYCERNVGTYNDEVPEQNILKSNILEYAELISSDNDIVYELREAGVTPISESVERDHGVSAYLPFTPLLIIGRFSEQLLSTSWHIYTYMIYFFGVVMFYLIINHLFKNRKFALLAAIMYMFSPRIFADGLYNNKDIVLLSFVLATIYFGIRFIEKKDFKDAILLGVVAGIASNTKIIGIFIFGIVGLVYLIHYIVDCLKTKKFANKQLGVGVVAILGMLITFIMVTPAIWGSGNFQLIDHLKWCLTESTKFSRWNGSILFEGVVYSYANGDSLPWYYLLKMIFITTPPYLLFLYLIGVISIVFNYIKKKQLNRNHYFCMIFMCMFIPILVEIFTHAKIYNGWRHFYFVYGPIVLISIYGMYNLLNYLKLNYKKYIYFSIGACALFYVVCSLKYGVNNTAYFNVFVNSKDLSSEYELDYYGATAKQVLKQAIYNKKEDIVYIHARGYSYVIIENNCFKLSQLQKYQMRLVREEDEYEQLKKEGKEVYLYYNNVYDSKDSIKNLEKVYSETSWGNDVSALYK